MSTQRQPSVHAGGLILVNQRLPFVPEAETHVMVPVCRQQERVLLERRAAGALARLLGDIPR